MADPGHTGDFDMKKSRIEEHPSGWMKLTRYETVRLIVDALLEASPDHKFNKSELERRTGASREAIREHLPLLVELGVVEEINDGNWAEYKLNEDGKVTRELHRLSSALNSVLSGETKNVQDTPQVTLDELAKREVERRSSSAGIERLKRTNAEPPDRDDTLTDSPPGNLNVTNAD